MDVFLWLAWHILRVFLIWNIVKLGSYKCKNQCDMVKWVWNKTEYKKIMYLQTIEHELKSVIKKCTNKAYFL